MSYSIVNPDYQDRALSLARGCYQSALILGYEALSGGTLKGKAKSYGIHYMRSGQNLVNRLRDNGIPVREESGAHNKRILVIG